MKILELKYEEKIKKLEEKIREDELKQKEMLNKQKELIKQDTKEIIKYIPKPLPEEPKVQKVEDDISEDKKKELNKNIDLFNSFEKLDKNWKFNKFPKFCDSNSLCKLYSIILSCISGNAKYFSPNDVIE